MKHRRLSLLACLLTARASPVQADEPHVETGATVAYALPAGNLERGSQVSDVTYGLSQLAIDGAYRLDQQWAAGLVLRYGIAIPKLCSSSSTCLSSLGSDTTFAALGRWHPGAWKKLEPAFDVELGYEWFKAKDSDNSVTSSRSYRGWCTTIGAYGAFRLGRRLTFGPTISGTAGVFQHAALAAPGVSASHDTDGALLHLWLAVGVRGSAEW